VIVPNRSQRTVTILAASVGSALALAAVGTRATAAGPAHRATGGGSATDAQCGHSRRRSAPVAVDA
jgi:uncharacterized membrane protein